MLRILSVLLLIATLTACATTSGMRREPLDEGVERRYQAPVLEVVNAAREAVTGAGIEIKEVQKVDERTWMILGNKSAGVASWGELVRVVIEGTERQSIVRVVTKRRLATNVTAEDDWSRSIFDQLELILATPAD